MLELVLQSAILNHHGMTNYDKWSKFELNMYSWKVARMKNDLFNNNKNSC